MANVCHKDAFVAQKKLASASKMMFVHGYKSRTELF